MNTDLDDGKLKSLLGEWKVDASLPPRFSESVWRRVEAESPTDRPGLTLWQLARGWLGRTLARPVFALAYCSVLLVAGLAFGFHQAQQTSAQTEAQLEARYVQSLSPYYKVHP